MDSGEGKISNLSSEAAEETARATRARPSIHRLFAEKCDPVTDAQLAASVFYWASGLDGPSQAAVLRIASLHMQAMTWRHTYKNAAGKGSGGATLAATDAVLKVQAELLAQTDDAVKAYVDELGPLTLARHAAYWIFLIQAFRLSEAFEEERAAYLLEFAHNLDTHLRHLALDSFQPNPWDDEALEPWVTALNLHARVWVAGRERGEPEAALIETMWKAEIP
jgi:hypothetical protein